MIVSMARIRILGPEERLEDVLDELQDLEVLHLTSPVALTGGEAPSAAARMETPPGEPEAAAVRERIEGIGWLLERLPGGERNPASGRVGLPPDGSALDALLVRLRRVTGAIIGQREDLRRERAHATRVQELLVAFRGLEALHLGSGATRPYFLVLEDGAVRGLEELREGLTRLLEGDFELLVAPPREGEIPVVLLVPAERAGEVEHLLASAGIQELSLSSGDPRHRTVPPAARIAAIEARVGTLEGRLDRLSRRYRAPLETRLREEHDRLLALEARAHAAHSRHAFVLQGFVPAEAVGRVEERLRRRAGPTVVVERQGRESWEGEPAPVVLHNPRLFRPFEAITRTLPLPRYGSIDPTPFVAVFFPMFFGVIVGDVAYGLVIALLALLLRRRSAAGGTRRSVAEIAGACSAFTIVFGFLYGEFAGDLGRRLFGMRPILFDREEALVPFLALAVALGFVQVLLGLVLGAISSFRGHRRQSVGRGLSALMLVLVTLALLAAVEVLPRGFFTPAVVALLVAFPVLVIVEGVLAPIELLSTLGNVLSYARIMAVGTASVMMAVVANRLAGAVGGILVGVLFGLLFHVVNFGLALFGPTIHGLRLHYVEFFGKFFSPGGVRYRPFGHWRPESCPAPDVGAPPNPSAATAARSA